MKQLFLILILSLFAAGMQAQQTANHRKVSKKKSKEIVQNDKKVYIDTVTTHAQFPGGLEALNRYMRGAITYPPKAIKKHIHGTVSVQFIVNKDGTISNVKVIRSVSRSLDAEAIRVIRNMPKWKPATFEGKEVNAQYTLPIIFKL